MKLLATVIVRWHSRPVLWATQITRNDIVHDTGWPRCVCWHFVESVAVKRVRFHIRGVAELHSESNPILTQMAYCVPILFSQNKSKAFEGIKATKHVWLTAVVNLADVELWINIDSNGFSVKLFWFVCAFWWIKFNGLMQGIRDDGKRNRWWRSVLAEFVVVFSSLDWIANSMRSGTCRMLNRQFGNWDSKCVQLVRSLQLTEFRFSHWNQKPKTKQNKIEQIPAAETVYWEVGRHIRCDPRRTDVHSISQTSSLHASVQQNVAVYVRRLSTRQCLYAWTAAHEETASRHCLHSRRWFLQFVGSKSQLRRPAHSDGSGSGSCDIQLPLGCVRTIEYRHQTCTRQQCTQRSSHAVAMGSAEY